MSQNEFFQRLYDREKNSPDVVYMTQPYNGGQTKDYTWKQTLDEARRMAAYLRSLELEPGSRIAMISKNCTHFIITELAIWLAGHVSVALYPTLNADTVQYTLEHSESALVFVGKLDDGPWEEMQKGIPDDLPKISFPKHISPPNDFEQWDDIIAQHEPISDNPHPDLDKLAIIVYTSGSTGRPKGVMHNFHNLAESARGAVKLLNVSDQDRMLSYLPLAHVLERFIVAMGSLWVGYRVYFAESLNTFIKDLNRANPTIFASVPRLWLKFQQGVFQKMKPEKLAFLLKIPIVSGIIKKKILKGLGLDQVRFAFSGSAPIPAELIEWYRSLGLELLEAYGMSENFAYSHCNRPGETRAGYVGHSNPDVDTKISEQGEILVKSPCTMVGYYKMPEESAECMTEDGYLKTGDRGEIDAQGRLRITGRVKELFKTSKGKYVAPAPIENLINNNPLVEQSCVSGSGYPSAYAVLLLAEEYRGRLDDPKLRAELEPKLKALLKEVNNTVEHHEHLQFFAVAKDEWSIENGFLTPTMKIKRNIIDDTYGPKLDGWYESKTHLIWEE
ncbi:MAG: AMP-binding acetyl-CoA synthetase [Deltaproteobacteria bacterium]|nr:MAG: AMP-binding acetyl-CoA synthetase [Deltaproteobacteria bacterium]